ncbi:MAG: ROK family protein [Leptolinea sp.]|jgi:polyphosphate glucokinase|nr:ROK family protein [Leptolinea sp.]
MDVLGLDIGGSGIKGALVDVTTGSLTTERFRLPTPEEARPDDVAEVVSQVAQHFSYKGVLGAGFPAVVHHGVAYSAANVDKSWIGTDVSALLTTATGCKSYVLNDADAAGLAEMEFGAGRKYKRGVVIMLTIGTGIGSAVFIDGHLFPNTEFGHLEIRGKDAERRASDAARERKKWTWEEWAMRFQEALSTYERLFSPDVFIIGGGASKSFNQYAKYLRIRAEIIPAQLLNQAGLVGAAVYASRSNALIRSARGAKKAE